MAENAKRRRRSRRTGSKKAFLVLLALVLLALGGVKLRYALAHRSLPGSNVSVPDFVTVDYSRSTSIPAPARRSGRFPAWWCTMSAIPARPPRRTAAFSPTLRLTHETYASAHFVVGLDGEILQCVPLTEIAYCSNTANDYTVSIEVCHPDDTGKFNDATMESLEQLVAWLCETFSLDPDADVIRHYDVTGKICPKYYVENEDAWLSFKQDVSTRIEEDNAASGETN